MVCDYEEQLRFKQEDLRQSLIKYAHVDPRKIEPIRPSEKTLFYRNQCKLPCGMAEGELVNGMYMPNSNIFVPMETCFVHEKDLEIMRKRILKVLNHDINRLGVVLDEMAAIAGDAVKVTVTVSADEAALPHDVKKYL